MRSRVTIIDDADRIEVLEAALKRIVDWSETCPIERYAEPDYRRSEALLKAGGMTLEILFACNMRHTLEGAGQIAREALNHTGAYSTLVQ